MIESFDLNYGENKIQYFLQKGKVTLEAMSGKIYKLHQNSKIIISDIDGTVNST